MRGPVPGLLGGPASLHVVRPPASRARQPADLDDAGTGSLSEAKCHDAQLGDLVQAHVVGDGAHHHGDLVGLRAGEEQKRCFLSISHDVTALTRTHGLHAASAVPHLLCHELGELGEGQGGPVGPGQEQALENHLVEVALCAPDQELVQLRMLKREGTGVKVRQASH